MDGRVVLGPDLERLDQGLLMLAIRVNNFVPSRRSQNGVK